MKLKRIVSVLSAIVLAASQTAAFAKSDALIDSNIDYMRSLLNEKEFRVYRSNNAENYVYYGAKFEPRAGVHIGTPEDKMYEGVENAIDTEYYWFHPQESVNNANCPREEKAEKASDHTELRGINWNFASKEYVNMGEYENYVKNFIDDLSSRGCDILLIFGKEMNIDDNFIDENVFIDAFRYVADYAHTKENIAMVWAPNDTGGLDTRLIDFYPGDEYVDWIGCSLYSMPYFQGNPNATEGSNIGFIMGPYANPVMRAKVIAKFMEENNINKPVCITEGGVGWYSPRYGTDHTDWAMQQLRRYYGEMCIRYPQFKCIVSFNNYYGEGPEPDYYRYDMGTNPQLLDLYQQLTKDPIYLTSYPSSSDRSYTELNDYEEFNEDTVLCSYAYYPKSEWINVKYEIDGRLYHESVYPPYKLNLKDCSIGEGEHTLSVKEYIGDSKITEKNISFKYTEPKANTIYADVADNGKCTYSDMADKPAQMRNAAASLSEKGIINGVSKTEFAPDKPLTRAEISAMLLRLKGIDPKGGKSKFSDVSENDWYFDIASKACDEGIIAGFDDGTFRGGEYVSKSQLAVMMSRMLGDKAEKHDLEYSDNEKIPSWAYEHIQRCDDILLKNDRGTFGGDSNVSRGDCAVMIERLYEKINKQ